MQPQVRQNQLMTHTFSERAGSEKIIYRTVWRHLCLRGRLLGGSLWKAGEERELTGRPWGSSRRYPSGDDLMLLYAIGSKADERVQVLGEERYAIVPSAVNRDFQDGYQALTNRQQEIQRPKGKRCKADREISRRPRIVRVANGCRRIRFTPAV